MRRAEGERGGERGEEGEGGGEGERGGRGGSILSSTSSSTREEIYDYILEFRSVEMYAEEIHAIMGDMQSLKRRREPPAGVEEVPFVISGSEIGEGIGEGDERLVEFRA